LLDAGEIAGVTMECGCVGCLCGTCAVEIVSGMKNLTPADAHEQDLLKERGKDPKHFRLACCTKVIQGEVTMRRDF
jgi:ferredoxin